MVQQSGVRVRYFAGARAAAGVAEEHIETATNVADVLATVCAARGSAMTKVLARCSFLLNGVAVHDHGVVVSDGAELDVLPPFAGG